MRPLPLTAYTLLAAVLVAGFVAAGYWQSQRGHQKQIFIAQQDLALRAPPVELDEALSRIDDGLTRRVSAEGRFRAPPLLLDGQQRNGRVGVRVYGVAETLAGSVLVDLGWVPWRGDRELPRIDLPQGAQRIAGLLRQWPGQGLRMAPNPWPEALNDAPVLVSYLDAGEIGKAYGVPLPSAVVRLDPALDYGYERDLEAFPNTLPPERHFGYAVQWFALAATVFAVYLVLIRRAWRRKESA